MLYSIWFENKEKKERNLHSPFKTQELGIHDVIDFFHITMNIKQWKISNCIKGKIDPQYA